MTSRPHAARPGGHGEDGAEGRPRWPTLLRPSVSWPLQGSDFLLITLVWMLAGLRLAACAVWRTLLSTEKGAGAVNGNGTLAVGKRVSGWRRCAGQGSRSAVCQAPVMLCPSQDGPSMWFSVHLVSFQPLPPFPAVLEVGPRGSPILSWPRLCGPFWFCEGPPAASLRRPLSSLEGGTCAPGPAPCSPWPGGPLCPLHPLCLLCPLCPGAVLGLSSEGGSVVLPRMGLQDP